MDTNVNIDFLYLVYKTDKHHSFKSRDVIGIASTILNVVEICTKAAEKEGYPLNDNQLFNLGYIKQTQGYEGDCEFPYESVDTDILILG